MNEALKNIQKIAAARNYSEDLTNALLKDYNKGREAHEGKDGDWNDPDFDFPENIMQEIAGTLNYIFEGTRQGKLPREAAHNASTYVRWAADEITNSKRREF